MLLLGNVKPSEEDIKKSLKESIGYVRMSPPQKAVADRLLGKLVSVSTDTMFYCLAPASQPKPLVVDCRDPATQADRNDCKIAIPGAIEMRTNLGQCQAVFDQHKVTNSGPFVTDNRPKAVVFYCSFGQQRSPEIAYRYLEWLEQKKFAQPTEVAYMYNGIKVFSMIVPVKIEQLAKKGEATKQEYYVKTWP